MIDQFTREEFETYLKTHNHDGCDPFQSLDIIDGEWCYKIPLDGQSAIMIRSSVKAQGIAAKSGKDSIRLWLVGNDNKPLGSKIDSWTTRVKGWQERLNDKIRELTKRRLMAGDCQECSNPFGIYKRKKDKKLFVKCFPCSERMGKNINGNLNSEGWFAPASRGEKNVSQKIKDDAQMAHHKNIDTADNVMREKVEWLCDGSKKINRQRSDMQDMSGDRKQELVTEEQAQEFIADILNVSSDTVIVQDITPPQNILPNPQQSLAINMPIDANVRLLAGPGTGKTFTIKYRYQYLVANGVKADNILVITYSKPMADEMGEKIISLTPDAKQEQISTIHAFCYRELTRNNPELQYYGWEVPGKHAPLKSWQVKQKVEDLIAEIWPKQYKNKPGYKEVLEWIDRSKYAAITQDNAPDWFISYLGAYFGLMLAKIRVRFDKWLYSYRCMTFSDMLYLMEQELVINSDFKAKMQAKYSHVIVDESQDTNYQAFRILYHLFENGTKLFLVGDVNQMMYRFQGAKPELITDEIDKILPDIQTIKLETNHRSNDEIIKHYQRLIIYNYSDKNGPYGQEFFQDMSGVKGSGGSVTFEMADDVFEESAKIAEEIKVLCEIDYKPGNIFVGARTKAQLGYLEGELMKAGIKFINIAGGSFWNNKHVKNVVSYLRLAYNATDKEALAQVANIASNENCYTWNDKNGKFEAGDYCPVRYLGAKFLEKIDCNFNNIDNFLFSAQDAWRYKTNDNVYHLYGATKAQDLQEFVWKLQDTLLQADNIGQVIQVIIDDCYEKYLKTTEGSANDDESNLLDNLTTVVEMATQYTKAEDFLSYVDEMIQAAQDTKDKNWDEYVVISTYHRLKGLEREIIFGMGWCEGKHKITDDPVGLLPHTFSLIDPPQFGVLPAGVKSPLEDERCIAFVCISRAMEKTCLSGCAEYRGNKMWQSRFINEILGEKE